MYFEYLPSQNRIRVLEWQAKHSSLSLLKISQFFDAQLNSAQILIFYVDLEIWLLYIYQNTNKESENTEWLVT
jgi:hypothetical protein